jgi:predicted SnoaL-like aldol condensation-catalyzing enzyme
MNPRLLAATLMAHFVLIAPMGFAQAPASAQTTAQANRPVVAAKVPPASESAAHEANKNLLLEFFRLGGDLEGRRKMLTDDYVQHNPRFLKMDETTGKKGGDAWKAALETAQGHARLTDPTFSLRSTPVAMLAEGDYVVAIYRATVPDPDDPTKTYEAFNFELVRFKDGKLAEHWDALKLAPGWRTELEKPAGK